jgi:hypothetical protein
MKLTQVTPIPMLSLTAKPIANPRDSDNDTNPAGWF